MRILNDKQGHPYWIETEPGEDLAEALALVPDDVLLAAYERAWAGSGLPMPSRSAAELRDRLLTDGRRDPGRSTRLAPISEAARELDLPETTLRLRVSQGLFKTARLRNGKLAVELPTKHPRRLGLIPSHSRPDPRLVLAQRKRVG